VDADLHALILLGLLPAGTVVALVFRGHSEPPRLARARAIQAVLAFAGTIVVVYLLTPYCTCGPKNNPSVQLWFPPIVAALCAIIVNRKWLRRTMTASFTIAALFLASNFHALVLDTTRCAYTGEIGPFISNSCNKPAQAVALWHTWFTGIYGINLK
jgi:hypothetical protein